MPIRRPLASALVLTASLAAQTPLEALRQVPRNAQGFLLVPDPAAARTKYQPLAQRMDEKAPDFWAELLKEFGLERLPEERRGIVVALVPDESTSGEPVPLLLVAASDPKAWAAELKATSKDGRVYAFKKGERGFLMAPKGAWALVAPQAHSKALRRALAAQDSVLSEVDQLAPWLQTGDLAAVLTPQGLQSALIFARKALGEARSRALSLKQASQSQDVMEQILQQVEREVTHVGLKVDVDGEGNLRAAARLQLKASGLWAEMGRDLPVPSDAGLRGLPLVPYTMAMGGSLPAPWMALAVEKSLGNLRALFAQAGLKPDQIKRFDAAQAKTQEGIHGLGVIVAEPTETSGPMPFARLDVDDAAEVFQRMDTWGKETAAIFREGRMASPYTLQRETMEGLPVLKNEIDLGKLPLPKAEGAEPTPGVTVCYVAPDPKTLLMGFGAPETMAPALQTLRAPERGLAQEGGVRTTAGLLPSNAHYFTFVDLAGTTAGRARAMRRFLPDAVTAAVAYPEMPSAPPLGLAVRFDLAGWELRLAFPASLQEALTTFSTKQKVADEAQAKAMEAWTQAHPPTPDEDEDEGEPESR